MSGIANRMAYVLGLHVSNAQDDPIVRGVKCRLCWWLFMADRWCPPALGLPRNFDGFGHSPDVSTHTTPLQVVNEVSLGLDEARRDHLWTFMIAFADILGPIQDLNLCLIRTEISRHDVDRRVMDLSSRLQAWHDTLPARMIMNEDNLDMHRTQGVGGIFVSCHLGYHHYWTLLYFQYLDAPINSMPETQEYAARCKHHALSFSRLLYHARQKSDCEVVYFTVAQMTIVSSSVLLHMILLGDEEEVEIAHVQLVRNFEALIELTKYWPKIDNIIQRLLLFQNACLRSTTAKTHAIDRWMVGYLMQYALPLEEKTLEISEASATKGEEHPAMEHQVSSSRTLIVNSAFEGLRTIRGEDD